MNTFALIEPNTANYSYQYNKRDCFAHIDSI